MATREDWKRWVYYWQAFGMADYFTGYTNTYLRARGNVQIAIPVTNRTDSYALSVQTNIEIPETDMLYAVAIVTRVFPGTGYYFNRGDLRPIPAAPAPFGLTELKTPPTGWVGEWPTLPPWIKPAE